MPSYAELVGPELGRLTAVHAPAPFACVRVSGPDAVAFLQRLCSQDIAGALAGEARPAAFLTGKGRLETLVWVGCLGSDVWLEAQAQEATKLVALIERYHFTERVKVEGLEGFACHQVLGPDAWRRAQVTAPSIALDASAGTGGVRFAGVCRGLSWVRWHGPAPDAGGLAAGLPAIDDATWQYLRVAAGVPWLGVDVDANHLGPELDIDDHLSATKGCYTGQEIVARIYTYGHTNRRLCRLRLHGNAAFAPSAMLLDGDGDPVGRVTSMAQLPGAARLGLAVLPSAVAAPKTMLAVADSEVRVEVC